MKKVLFLFGMLTLVLTACGGLVGRSVKSGDGENGTPELLTRKILGPFYPIPGTHYQLASITYEQDYSGRTGGYYDYSQLFASGRADFGVYNYVFFDVDSEAVYPLLPTNDTSILSIQGYPQPNATDQPKLPVAWWLFTLAKTDTNGDEKLSALDLKTLSISDVGGKGYTELVSGVDAVLGDAYKDGNVLLLIYRAGDKNFLAHIDLAARKVIKTTELKSFGADVK